MTRQRLFGLLVLLLAGCGAEPPPVTNLQQTLGGEADPGFRRALTPRPFEFPADHGAHPAYQTEWWYFTGHLAVEDEAESSATPRRFGYQLTFFRQALKPDSPAANADGWSTGQLYLAHFAVSDLDGAKFFHDQRLSRGAAGLAAASTDRLLVELDDWSARWQENVIELKAASDDVSLRLNLKPVSPVVPHGDRGLSVKGAGPGNASYYYSIPELASSGTVTVAGKRLSVSGSSWLDREWSTSVLSKNQTGWDWFSLQLGAGRYLMLFQLRDAQGRADGYAAGTLVDGSRQLQLTAKDFTLSPGGYWRSPHSGARYPLSWRLEAPGQQLVLEVNALLDDQELNQTFRYWEGAVSAAGRWGTEVLSASGYLEMTGYDTAQ